MAKTGDIGQQHWRDLCEAVKRESERVGGHGKVILEISLQGGLPRHVACVQVSSTYICGSAAPPLTGDSPLAIEGS